MISIYIEIAGVFIAAVAGAVASSRVKMDLFGVVVCGTIAALGGGTVRDILLGIPVFWTQTGSEIYMTSAVFSALFTFIWVRYRLPVPVGTLRILDAIVLGIFGFLGTAKTVGLGFSSPIAIAMGVVTGVAGGMLRDLLTGNVPYVLRPGELYATAVFAGAGLFCLLVRVMSYTPKEALIPTIATIIFFRIAAIRWNWNLPSYRDFFNQEDDHDWPSNEEPPPPKSSKPLKPSGK